jgi:hypothetical protein
MKQKKKQTEDDARTLFFPLDPSNVRSMICMLIRNGNYVHRKSQYHIKCGPWNYYLPRGKITKDPDETFDEQGPDAFIALVGMALVLDI